jgi:hypothetical protein
MQLNTRHPQWAFEERFGGGGEKDINMLKALGRWTLAYNNLLKVVLPPGWEQLRGEARRELFARALAHMMPATLKDPALTGVQMMVNNGDCMDPRELPTLVFRWCFPPPTAEDTAERALDSLTLKNGVAEFEQGLRICVMIKFQLPLGVRHEFDNAQNKEMLSVIRRAVSGTKCEQSIHWLHTFATQMMPFATHSGMDNALLVKRYLEELKSIEARFGRHYLLKHHQGSSASNTPGSSPRGGRSDQGQRYREEDPRRAQVNNMGRKQGGGGRAASNQDWRTSPATGSLLLKAAPPDGFPNVGNSRTLLHVLAKQNKCFWCMEPGHTFKECPQRQKPEN